MCGTWTHANKLVLECLPHKQSTVAGVRVTLGPQLD